MKRLFLVLLLMAALPYATMAQADAKLISKAEKGDVKAMVLLGECYEQAAGVPLDSAQALKWFQKASDLGDGNGAIRVARYYLNGTLLPRDTARYVSIRREWAEKGLPDALAAMYFIYEDGIGVKVDSAKAWDYLQQAVKKGSAWGYEYMGTCYALGEYGQKVDMKKAVDYWQKAFKKGDRTAGDNLVVYYIGQQDYKTALRYIREALDWGEPWAYARMAYCYYLGNGVEMDERKAQELASEGARLFPMDGMLEVAGRFFMTCDNEALVDEQRGLSYWKQGAAQKGSKCMLALGYYHLQADDYAQARACFEQLAEMKKTTESGEACYQLSYISFNGLGCDESLDDAIRWLKKGADECKSAECANTLAGFYADADYLNDQTMAVKYYRRAVDLGNTESLSTLGQLYADNGNVDRAMACFQEMVDKGDPNGYRWMSSVTNRVDYLETGAKQGSADCAAILGVLYEQGSEELGIQQDVKKAERYFKQAGTSAAKYRLGRMYLDGRLGKQKPVDIAKGLDLVEQASSEGFVEAIFLMGHCYETGSYVDSVDHVRALSYYTRLAENGIPGGLFKLGLYHELGDGGVEQDSLLAIDYYQRAAAGGHGLAMCYLGDFYRIGRFLPHNPEKAFALYREADSVGEVSGTYYMARSYLEGCGVPVDTAAAIPLLKQAAAYGVGNASYRLAEMYAGGLGGLPQDADSARTYYFQGHNNGSADASYFIGRQLLREGHEKEGVEYLYTAARRGSVDGMVLLALCMQQGVGIEADPEEAYEILQAAVHRADNANAYERLGLATLQGLGCEENNLMAKRYFDTAAMLGSVNADLYLGLCYLNGWGCVEDTTVAVGHLERAADNGIIRAINELGEVYEDKGDFKNAVLYYEKGVSLGSLESYCKLGYCYEEGNGVVLNSKKAYELYMTAAEHEYVRAYLMLAQCYMNGMYVERSMPEAMQWLEKAANAGNTLAMYYLGSYYADGTEGVPADAKKAKAWYKKAADAGYVPAQAALERMK